MKSMLRESQMAIDNSVPSLDEYMENGYVSFALGPIVLPALYLVGPKLSEDDVQKAELHNLYKLMSTCGRLLNDIQSFKVHIKEMVNSCIFRSIIRWVLLYKSTNFSRIKMQS